MKKLTILGNKKSCLKAKIVLPWRSPFVQRTLPGIPDPLIEYTLVITLFNFIRLNS